MSFFHRGIVYLRRNISYSLILFMIIFLLGSGSLGIYFSYRMVERTEENLWSGLPAVVSIEVDLVATQIYFDTMGIWIDPPITQELIKEISQLPYVERANISLNHHLYGRNLNRHWEPEAGIDNLYLENFDLNAFNIKGVTQPNFLELSSGMLEIVSGNTFSDEQLIEGRSVVIISQELANANDLEIGSLITIETLHPWDIVVDESLEIEFEVVGIYELRSTLNEFANTYPDGPNGIIIGGRNHIAQRMNLLNQIYVPFSILEYMLDFQISMRRNVLGENAVSDFRNSENFILLNDSRRLREFNEAVDEILPNFLIARDVTDSFQNVFTSMNQIRNASSFLLILFVGGSALVLILLIVFLVQERKNEIGIYLALGEKKWRVKLQLIMEVVYISFIAIALSLFTSQIISSQVAHYILREEMANVRVSGNTGIVEIGYRDFMDRGENLLDWFVPEVNEIERLIELSDVSLSFVNITIFYLASLSIIIISAFFSSSYLMRLSPKEFLSLKET